MNIKFVIDVDPEAKTGLYNAVEEKIKYWGGGEIYNITYYDSCFLKITKLFFKKKTKKKIPLEYFANSKVKNIYIKQGVLSSIGKRLKYLHTFIHQKDSKLLRKAIGDKPALLSAHWGITAGILARYATMKTKHHYTITCHGSDVHTYPKKNKYLKEELIKALSDSQSCIFVSSGLKKEAKAIGFSTKNSNVIYNGINTCRFKNRTKKFNFKRIGFIGNLFKIKGADIFARVCALLERQQRGLKYVVIGDGEQREYMKTTMPACKSTFLGKVKPEDIPDILSTIDLIVIPSRKEGLSLVALEAQAAGVKVVASDVGGLPEAVGQDNVVPFSESDNFEVLLANKIFETLQKFHPVSLPDQFDLSVTKKEELDHFHKIYSHCFNK
ncbi:glycosyltransferase [Endozoicomonas gorgoniicola]|uniref:Glycosyltransferase n=1 Tax=Endozoicomonas gorgoniicola TaxID=1234144 RepID=A0ABT3MQJ2_9GAMM|nr:glycosyltransferase [Endozoicomonas gorgoniicola]MCW7551383.1 glycosyltransferase [Endozoicomonas gorgoniicola]